MTRRRLVIPLFSLSLLASLTPVWSHQGVIHADGVELHFRLEVLTVGPDQRFQVTMVHLPDAPLTGQDVQFLVRLEETLAEADPLLGGHTPVVPQSFKVWIEGEQGSSLPLEVREEEEAGVYGFNHVFARSGEWKLLFEFEDTNQVKGNGELIIPLESAPVNWPLLLFQGMIIVTSLGLVFQRFRAPTGGSSLLFALMVLAIGGTTLILVDSFWPSGDLGTLEIAALSVPLEEPAGVEDWYQTPAELLQEPQFVSEPRNFVGTVRHATNRIMLVRSPLPGTVVFHNGVPKIGDRVEAGQVLATIENQFIVHDYSHLLNLRWELQKIIMQTSERKVQAEAAFQRAASLLDLGVISRREFERKELEFNQADTESRTAQERLRLHDTQLRRRDLYETQLLSPISGYISRATYSAGQLIYEDDPLFEIVDTSVVWVEVFALPQDFAQLESEPEVTLRSPVLKQTFTGRLVNIRPDTEPGSKALRVLYEVKNPDLWLRPGMLLDVYPPEEGEDTQQAATQPLNLEAGN
ncbi:MAG: efflux RND transporter periplasmic adaptor subunit [Acidobacteriota bacterium]